MKNTKYEGPTPSGAAEGNRGVRRSTGEPTFPLTQSKTPARHQVSSTREPGDLQRALPGVEPGEHVGEAPKGTRPTKKLEESDGAVVPEKPANKAGAAEPAEGRAPAKGKAAQGNPHRTQGRLIDGETGLRRLRKRFNRSEAKKEKLTNLFTHLRVDLFETVYRRLKKKSAPGVDEQTWSDYGEELQSRLTHLQERLHRGGYRPPPVRRVHISKPDGSLRPLGLPTIEDKVVQGAVVALLTPVYEAEFLECSYGFRPGRNQHQALDAVERMMYRGKVNWVLDIDIRSYFDSISHEWLVRMLEHRIGDRRLLRLIQRWLKAGIMEDGKWRSTEEGSPQGGCISPLLANVFLHYVLDLWFAKERKRMSGAAHMVRFADDAVFGFQHRHEAEAFQRDLMARLGGFGLQLHPDKTQLLRFGKFAGRDCHQDGRRRPGTFEFLGFTHISGRNPDTNGFRLIRRTAQKKRTRKLVELRAQMRQRMHWKITDQWRWLCSVLRGHYNYYGLSGNFRALQSFRYHVWLTWHRVLQRRSQRSRMTRARLDRLDQRFPLPRPRILRRQRSLFPCL